jgi:hypothetical protein
MQGPGQSDSALPAGLAQHGVNERESFAFGVSVQPSASGNARSSSSKKSSRLKHQLVGIASRATAPACRRTHLTSTAPIWAARTLSRGPIHTASTLIATARGASRKSTALGLRRGAS